MTDVGAAQRSHKGGRDCWLLCKGPVEGCLHKWIDRGSPPGTAPPRHAPASSLRLLASPFVPNGDGFLLRSHSFAMVSSWGTGEAMGRGEWVAWGSTTRATKPGNSVTRPTFEGGGLWRGCETFTPV